MAITTSQTHEAPAVAVDTSAGELRHVPLSQIVVLSRGSAASVRMVARSG